MKRLQPTTQYRKDLKRYILNWFAWAHIPNFLSSCQNCQISNLKPHFLMRSLIFS